MSLTGIQVKDFYIDRWLRTLEYLWKLHDDVGLDPQPENYKKIKSNIEDFSLSSSGKKVLSESELKELNQINKTVWQFLSSASGIAFVNRDLQRERIKGEKDIPGRPHEPIQLILLDAPARYGKTFLLEKIQDDLLEVNAQDHISQDSSWIVVSFPFREYPETALNLEAFLRKFWERVKLARGQEIKSDVPDNTELMDRIFGNLRRSRVAILIDDAELASKEIIQYLRDDLFPNLADKAKESGTAELRCVVSGRNISKTWKEPVQSYTHRKWKWEIEHLGPLEQIHTLDALDKLIKNCPDLQHKNTPINREKIAQITDMIASGHPECVVSVLLYIGAKTSFSYTDKFLEKHRMVIFDQCVKPVLDLVLAEDKRAESFFREICILRRYEANSIKLINKKYSYKNLHALQALGLMQRNRERIAYYDDRIRRILAYEKWSNRFEEAKAHNKKALNYFLKMLKTPEGIYKEDLTCYSYAFSEYVFHLVMDFAHGGKPVENQRIVYLLDSAVKTYERNWKKRFHISNKEERDSAWVDEKERLQELILDSEIVGHTAHFLGDEYINIVESVLNP